MSSVRKRGAVWYVKFLTASGTPREERSPARSRDEAKRFAAELEAKQYRIARGLEVEPGDPTLTFGNMYGWYLESHGAELSSMTIGGKAYSMRKHVLPALGELSLREVTAARLERLFDEMGRTLSASTVNTLRAQLRAVFGRAAKRGLWAGANPAAATERRQETRKEFDELTADEVPVVLEQLDARWRALFATAIFTGMRKGELAALRREDVDLEAGLIHVGRSWGADTTKGRTTKAVPIAAALRPYLAQALAASKGSPVVFPGANGKMMRSDVKLAPVLRRALARGGLTRGWLHVCRRRGKTPCDFTEKRDHDLVEPCPKCGFKLWPKPIYRAIRFHDTRSTTATLLARSGASPAVAGRVLRHSDPSLTLRVYTRVRSEDMLQALDAMVPSLNPPASQEANREGEAASGRQAAGAGDRLRAGGPPTLTRLAGFEERPRHDSNVLPRPSEYSPGGENRTAPRALVLNLVSSRRLANGAGSSGASHAAQFRPHEAAPERQSVGTPARVRHVAHPFRGGMAFDEESA